MNRRRYHLLDFPSEVNAAVVGDFGKLIMHRLVANQIRRDPSLVELAKTIQARIAKQHEGWPFVAEWDALLEMPPAELRAKLISRDREMVRLRNSSPFFLTEGVDFGEYDRRIRIARAARRIAQRSIRGEARRQRRILDLIPDPDEAFHRAARNAAIHAGLSEETVELLDQIARTSKQR
jgi:hypothetical protein